MDNSLIKIALLQALWWILALAGTGFAYFILSLPLRRHERARFFLDLLETGLKDGRSPEQSVVSLAQSRDGSLGARFHQVAAWIETGLRLGQALDRVPSFLPPRIHAMLKVGEEIGDVAKVLPACRRQLRDGASQSRGAVNYLLVAAFVLTPIAPAVFLGLSVFVFPKFVMVLRDMDAALPALTQFVMNAAGLLSGVMVGATALIYLVGLSYLAGPRMRKGLGSVWDTVAWAMPWKRNRIRRDFSAMFAALLDAGVPEERALTLAGASVVNRVIQRRTSAAAAELRAGVPLAVALKRLDDSSQFQWRLANAVQGRGGFLTALNGWLETLDAKAFQQEQAAAHLVTTGLVLFNGMIVGTLIAGVFLALISIIDAGVAW
ncbi:MAG: type II secretion system F family protein [Verrucomicrobia bacterium]|nr:type II secretion system F family protein [Verrucomicrobiota bacterium]